MADRSGHPAIDAAIEAFLDEPIGGDVYPGHSTIRSLLDPGLSHGTCQEITEQFVEFAKKRGLKAYSTDTDLDELGYQVQPGSTGGEIGFDENDEMTYGHYPEHTVASIYLDGSNFPVTVDFTASQYGYTDMPKVSSKTALWLPPKPPEDQRASTTPLTDRQQPGYQDGFAHGQEGITRNPAQPTDADYMAGYDIGWSEGVLVYREPASSWDNDDITADQTAGTVPDPIGPMRAAVQPVEPERARLVDLPLQIRSEGGFFTDLITGNPDQHQSPGWQGPDRFTSYDWCFTPDAPVLMADGTEKPISQIEVGDRVITHTGRIQPVTWVGSRPYEGDLVHVSVYGDTTREIVATDQHRFFSANRDFGLEGNRKAASYRGAHQADLASRSGWDQVGNLAPMDYLSRSVLIEEHPVLVSYADQRTAQVREMKVSGEVAWLLGLYMGDGFPQTGASSHRVTSFSLHSDQTALVDRIRSVAREHLGGAVVGVYPEPGKNAVRVDVRDWAFRRLSEEFVGHGSSLKRLDARLLTLPLEDQRWLIEGYLDSDGCRSADGRHCADSTSVMPRQVREIATRLGHIVNMRPKASIDQYANAKPKMRVEWWGGKNRLTKQFFRDDQVWQQVRSTRRTPYLGEVWDIEVAGDHSFRAYGFNVHNCRFRRDSHCWLPKSLNEAASKQMGYAVWIPEDRGHCARVKWADQKVCPTGQPGPHSGAGGLTDATVPFEQGGQQSGQATGSLHTAVETQKVYRGVSVYVPAEESLDFFKRTATSGDWLLNALMARKFDADFTGRRPLVEGDGIGVWWTTDLETAKDYSTSRSDPNTFGGPDYSFGMVLEAEVPVDANDLDHTPGFTDQHPVIMRPGAPVNITGILAGWPATKPRGMGGQEFHETRLLPVHQTVTASLSDTVHPVPGIVREYAMTPVGSEPYAAEMDDISRAYRDLPILDPAAVDIWRELGELCVAQAQALGRRYQVIRHDDLDPYFTAEQMYADVDRGIYQVTSLHSHHPVWDVDTNVAFRVTHDLTGHTPSHSDFSLKGEVIAYQNQCAQTPEHLWPALFTEIVAQSAYANVHHLFGEQKVGVINLTQAEIDAHVGRIMDSVDPAYDALHFSGSTGVVASSEIGPADPGVGVTYQDSSKKVQVISFHGARRGTLQKVGKNWVATHQSGDTQSFANKYPAIGWLLNHHPGADEHQASRWTARSYGNTDEVTSLSELHPGSKIWFRHDEIGARSAVDGVVDAITGSTIRVKNHHGDAFDIDGTTIGTDWTVQHRTARTAGMEFTASWRDIQAKAKRIRTSGGVRMVASQDNVIVAHVRGDSGVYETELTRNPGQDNVAFWQCGCRWSSYSWGRSGPWKKFEGRMCSHALAVQYEAQARNMFGRTMTLDEKQPDWMDHTPLRLPGDYDKNTQRYTSRQAGRYEDGVLAQHTDHCIDSQDQTATLENYLDAGHADPWSFPLGSAEFDAAFDDFQAFHRDSIAILLDSSPEEFCKCQDHTAARRYAHLRPVEDQSGVEDLAPTTLLAHQMLAESRPYQEVRAMLLAHGVAAPAAVVVAAKTKVFKGKVRGEVKDLVIADDGHVHDQDTGTHVDHTQVLFPGYDPSLGLNPQDQAPRLMPIIPPIVPLIARRVQAALELSRAIRSAVASTTLASYSNSPGGTVYRGIRVPVPAGYLEAMPPYQEPEEFAERRSAKAGSILLDAVSTTGNRHSSGLGVHWTERPEFAAGAAAAGGTGAWGEMRVVIEAAYTSADVEPEGSDAYALTGVWMRSGTEAEVLIKPGSRLSITGLWVPENAVEHSVTYGDKCPKENWPGGKWFNLLSGPVTKTADNSRDTLRTPMGDLGGNRSYADTMTVNGTTVYFTWKEYSSVKAFTEDPFVTVAGMSTWEETDHREVFETFVKPEYRRQGIASHMFDMLKGRFPDLTHAGQGRLSEEGAAFAEGHPASLHTAADEAPTVSGVALMAADTGRVLMLQRGLDDEDDPAAGTWEFPGGHHEDGDTTSLHAGIREWTEEVGQPFPEGGTVADTWTSASGVYQGHVVVIPNESLVRLHEGRSESNPDDPGGDHSEQAAWWDPSDAQANPALRSECKDTPWALLKKVTKAASIDMPPAKKATKETSVDVPDEFGSLFEALGDLPPRAAGLDDDLDDDAFGLLPEVSYDYPRYPPFVADWDDQPEPALPVTYSEDDEPDPVLGARSAAMSIMDALRPSEPRSRPVGAPVAQPPRTAPSAPQRPGAGLSRGARLLAEHDARLAGAVTGPDPFAHLIAGADDAEARQAAQAYLQREAVKTYTHAERQSIIDEGLGTEAANLSLLDITGTHYETLAASTAGRSVPEDEDLWLLGGDPNGADL